MRYLILFATVVIAINAEARDCNIRGLPRIVGMDYHHARAELITAGFMPLFSPKPEDSAPYEFDRAMRLGYMETIECGGTGSAGCVFTWATRTAPFFVETTGCEFLAGRCTVSKVTCH